MKHSDKELNILFCDNHLLVVDKPSGLLTQPTEQCPRSLEGICKTYIKDKYNKSGNVFLHSVHRLDKPVSGIVLFARTSKALSRLNEQMRNKQFIKIYYTLVEGQVMKKKATLQHYLLHQPLKAKVASEKIQGVKLAILHYEVLQINKNNTLLKVYLETGRYHQIRVQLAQIGHPILGDKKYGSRYYLLNQIKLHQQSISFKHPVTLEQLTLVSRFLPF